MAQKHILLQELVVGNIFTKEMKIKDREALVVEEIPTDKEYIIVKSRVDGKQKKMSTKRKMWVTLLHESDKVRIEESGGMF